MSKEYTGPVGFNGEDGFHYSIKSDPETGDQLDAKLFLDDDGTYRFATDNDKSWNERKHQRFASIIPEGGAEGLSVTGEEFAEIQKMLSERRK